MQPMRLSALVLFSALVTALSGCSCSDDPDSGINPRPKDDASVGDADLGEDSGDPRPDADVCESTDFGCAGDKEAPLTDDWFPPPDEAAYGGVEEQNDPGGGNPWLTLSGSGVGTIAARAVWISNTADGTVSRLDVETGKEVARYPSAITDAAYPQFTNNARPWNLGCTSREPDVDPGFIVLAAIAGTPVPNGNGNCPSRTSVDQQFNAYVANRAFAAYDINNNPTAGTGTVTKFANELSDCVDRNNDSTILTSEDRNDDGTIDTDVDNDTKIDALELPGDNPPDKATWEFYGAEDECVLWTRNAGGLGGLARALAVGKGDSPSEPGDVWVGLYGTRQLIRLDPYTGDTLATISVAGGANNMRPYGAAAGPDGKVWFVWAGWINSPGRNLLGYADPATNTFTKVADVPVEVASCARPYGMSLDPQGRIWIANTGCEPELIYYDPATATWDGVNVPGIKRQGLIGDENSDECAPVTEDMEDYFECTSGTGTVSKLQPVPRGVASSYKSIWFSVALRCPAGLTLNDILTACNFPGLYTGPGTAGEACCTANGSENLLGRVDLATKTVVKMTPLPTGRFPVGVGYSPNERIWVVGQNSNDVSYADLDENDERTSAWTTHEVGNNPYTYSDFIGFGLNELAAPDGYYRVPITGCDGGFDTAWTSLSYDAVTPDGTSVEFNVRTADSEVALEDALWVGPFIGTSPIDLTEAPGPVEDGRFMEVEIVLRTEQGTVKPKVRDLELGFRCTATNPG